MQAYGRMKRVTDPFDDKVKARIIGRDLQEIDYLSSGSEHSAYAFDDDDAAASCSFSELIFGFPDDVADYASSEDDSDSDEEDVSTGKEMNFNSNLIPKARSRGKDCLSYIRETTRQPLYKRCGTLNCDSNNVIEDVPKPIFYSDLDLFRNSLLTKVTKALELFSFLKSNKPILRRNVMTYLRSFGYNAAICKTKWESSGGLKAGNYEFIDVIRSDSIITRYIIDLDFAAEFEIARPTNHYERLLQSLRNVFVGKSEELKCILKVMSDAGRLSLRSKDLHIPPWRKHRFMQNKWLGAYKRTINILPSVNSSPLLPPLNQTNVVKCRSVGFNAAVDGRLLFPAAPRTR